jgi:precorrin-4/cobalt-precorrin-4 C11-methyltransferase
MSVSTHPIIFCGAGPGDPDLITVKGQQALQEADLIVYAGSLVPEAVLSWARPEVPKINSAGMHLDAIIDQVASAHAQGKKVVRLHTGDPSLYGAIQEQMNALKQRSIPYTVIPGVTAAFAAAAAMGIEYTLPEVSQTLILTRMAGRTPVPEKENLADLARHQTSMAIYLSISLIDEVADILIDHYGEDTICAIAYRVSQPEEKIFYMPLKRLAAAVRKENITRQALIIIGQVLGKIGDGATYTSKLYDKAFSHGYRTQQK